MKTKYIRKIISGGQSGVDRAALDFAISQEIPHGGSCPKGRRSETGRIPDRYQLTETQNSDYIERTLKNVLESDGTLILYDKKLSGGTLLTTEFCQQNGKPYLAIELSHPLLDLEVQDWIESNHIMILNVAGPRESKGPIYDRALDYLEDLKSIF